MVASANDGVRDYTEDQKTALLSPPGDAKHLADNILELLNNPEKRIHLAWQGYKHIQAYTWDVATTRLENILQKKFNGPSSIYC
ncbi:glycosyltransferase [Sulfobacillus thermosulfidooxidans]|uniref:glycosyltransferase n=1 Tax=Sulfobacillus thermosulfidooxidans TaxID=28034 RepID=UPI00096B75D8|nr:hypothetical protein BFX05_06045 [Sulfobacillus thermosulfidooxidans]OLZ17401.1 hypothetical protein BFX06_13475 [Sulfobacillus thermosulfidooxidans]OLZ21089.1 hypothetical protein BFX07_13820 [Sulfobacillus thermosulfidooxidans]